MTHLEGHLFCEGCGHPTPTEWWSEWVCECQGCGGDHLLCVDCGFGWGTPTMRRPMWVTLPACPDECRMAEEVAGRPLNALGGGVAAAYAALKTLDMEPVDQRSAATARQRAEALGLPVDQALTDPLEKRIGLRLADGRMIWYPSMDFQRNVSFGGA